VVRLQFRVQIFMQSNIGWPRLDELGGSRGQATSSHRYLVSKYFLGNVLSRDYWSCLWDAPSAVGGRSYMCWRRSEIALLKMDKAEIGLTDKDKYSLRLGSFSQPQHGVYGIGFECQYLIQNI
jgi:hypothetical protein